MSSSLANFDDEVIHCRHQVRGAYHMLYVGHSVDQAFCERMERREEIIGPEILANKRAAAATISSVALVPTGRICGSRLTRRRDPAPQ